MVLNRQQLAEHVGKLISDDRNLTHGDPHEQFETVERLADCMRGKNLHNDSARHAMYMICTKLSRIANGQNLQDHWLDIAGYALIAAEKAEKAL